MPATRTRGAVSISSRAVLSLFVFCAAASNIAFATTPVARTGDAARISVVSVSGEVDVTMAGAAADVRPQSTVSLPARVVTGSDGTLALTQAGTNITVAGDTDVEIPAEAVDGNLIARLVQHRGNVFYDVAHRDVGKLRVETPFLVAVIKGTQFNVAVQPDSTTISLFEGRLEIRTPDGSDIIQLNAGEIAIRSRTDDSIRVLGMNEERVEAPRPAGRPRDNAVAAQADATPGTVRSVDVAARNVVGNAPANLSVAGSWNRGAAEELNDRSTVKVAASLDLAGDTPAAGDTRANLDLGFASTGVNVSAGNGAIDAGVSAGVDLGAANVDLGVNASVDLGAGAVDLGVNAGASVGGVTAGVGLSAGVDLAGGSVGAALDTGFSLGGNAGVDIGASAGLDLGGGALDAGLGTGIDLGGAVVDVGVDAGVDLGGGTVDVGLDLGGATVDLGLDTGGGLDLDLGGAGDAVAPIVEPIVTIVDTIVPPVLAPILPPVLGGGGGGGGLLGGLLGRR